MAVCGSGRLSNDARCALPTGGELAYRLVVDTDGAVQVKGEMLRKWLLAAESERGTVSSSDQA